MRRIAVGLFVASMLLTGNTLQGVRDLRGAAPAYRQALRNRWHALEAAAARGERDVLIEPLQGRPESYITYFEVREDPEYLGELERRPLLRLAHRRPTVPKRS